MTTYNDSFDTCKPISDTTAQLNLLVNTALTYTVPGDDTKRYRMQVSLSNSANVWMGLNVTATSPSAGTITSNANIERINNREYRYVKGGDVLSFISNAAVTDVGLSLLSLPN